MIVHWLSAVRHHRPVSTKSAEGRPGALRRFAFVLGAGLALGAAGAASAAERPVQSTPAVYDDHAVKAAFLYNFARFTKWPAGAFAAASAPLHVCLFGDDSFAHALGALAGKRIGTRLIATIRLAELKESHGCHVLFVGAGARPDVGDIVAHLGARPVLTVSDVPGFADVHGIIGLKTVARRIRFQINVDAAREVGLDLSATLLALAEIVSQTSAAPQSRTDVDG